MQSINFPFCLLGIRGTLLLNQTVQPIDINLLIEADTKRLTFNPTNLSWQRRFIVENNGDFRTNLRRFSGISTNTVLRDVQNNDVSTGLRTIDEPRVDHSIMSQLPDTLFSADERVIEERHHIISTSKRGRQTS